MSVQNGNGRVFSLKLLLLGPQRVAHNERNAIASACQNTRSFGVLNQNETQFLIVRRQGDANELLAQVVKRAERAQLLVGKLESWK